VIDTTTTDGNGNYLFTDLIPGVYSVEFDISTLPPDYRFVSQDIGGDDTTDSDADPTTGRTVQTTLTAGENDLTWDAGIYQLASIGNLVWYDTDGDGVQDSGEIPMQNVTVHLLDSNGTIIDTTTTDVNGYYLFENLEPGDYAIEVVPPAGYGFTLQDRGGNDETDSDIDPNTGRTIVTTLDPGENDMSWDAGLVGIMSLGNLVWNDINNNGVVDAGEPGIAGVTVRLLNTSGTVLATTTTDANGNYLFSNLLPGDYQVEIEPPAGYVTSTGTNGSATGPYEAAPDPDNDINNDDNGTQNGAVIRSSTVTLSPNSEPINDGDTNANSNLTVDFGLYQPASLGDLVWHDQDGDGVQDPGEPGVPGVTVTLYTSDGTVVGTTTTDANGQYNFDNLAPGDYYVVFTNLPPELPFITTPNVGDDASDSDVDPATGRSSIVTLDPGEYDSTLALGVLNIDPSAITLVHFSATRTDAGVQVRWQTGMEQQTFGFHLYRSTTANRADAVRVTSMLVLSKGQAGGASYSWTDTDAQAGQTYYYWLHEVEVTGDTHEYGPTRVQPETSAASFRLFAPFVGR
jgi:protocatechuate 3,4-dioxygenase beta subunit